MMKTLLRLEITETMQSLCHAKASKIALNMSMMVVVMPKLKCPVEGCGYSVEDVSEFKARIKLFAHVAAKHIH